VTGKSESFERAQFISYDELSVYAARAAVSFESALAFLVTGELVDFFLELGYHDPIRNCPMDYTKDHSMIVGGLRAGRFCAVCSKKLDRNRNLKKVLTALLRWDRPK
jgi:hypothetical protein